MRSSCSKFNASAVCFLIFGIGINFSRTKAGDWQQLGFPGGDITALAACDGYPDVMYLAEYSRGFYKSTDRGRSWFKTLQDPGRPGTFIVVDPVDPDYVLYCTGLDGLFFSTNGGDAWNQAIAWAPSWVQMCKADPTIVYGLLDTANKYLSKSTDEGRTWVNLEVQDDYRSLVIDPCNCDRIYLGSDERIGIYVSDDGGNTVTLLGLADYAIKNIVVSEGNSHLLYATEARYGGGRLFSSLDQGITWKTIELGLGDSISGLAVLPRDDSVLFLTVDDWGSMDGDVGLHKSTDYGVTWIKATQGILDYVQDGVIVAGATDSVLCFNDHYGVYRSDDRGETWSASSAGLPYVSGSLIMTTPYSPDWIFLSDDITFLTKDAGATWRQTGIEITGYQYGISQIVCNPTNAGDILALDAATFSFGLYRSTDEGESWQRLNTGHSHSRVARNPQSPRLLLSVCNCFDPTIIRSVDDGETWQIVYINEQGGEPMGLDVAFSPANPDIAYALFDNSTFIKSTDAGMTWALIHIFEYSMIGFYIKPDSFDPAIVFLSLNRGGVYRSYDGGLTWNFIRSIVLSGTETYLDSMSPSDKMPGTIYGMSIYNMVKSLDYGDSWLDITDELEVTGRQMIDSYQGETQLDRWIYWLGWPGIFRKLDNSSPQIEMAGSWTMVDGSDETLFVSCLISDPDGVKDIDKIYLIFDDQWLPMDFTLWPGSLFLGSQRGLYYLTLPLNYQSRETKDVFLINFAARDVIGESSGSWPYLEINR